MSRPRKPPVLQGPQPLKFARPLNPSNFHQVNNGRRRSTVSRSKVPLYHLDLSEAQKESIEDILKNRPQEAVDMDFFPETQTEALHLLHGYGLDHDSLNSLGSKWNQHWTNKPTEHFKHVLLQCVCGYFKENSARRQTYPFTGCLAHVDIVTNRQTGDIVRVHGILTHNFGCTTANITNEPRIPLHPSVLNQALKQMLDGVRLTDIHRHNHNMVAARQYPDQSGIIHRHRYLLQTADHTTLYRAFYRHHGIDTTEKPHINIDNWFNPNSPNYNRVLSDAVFHYAARTKTNARLEVCIATREMNDAAWRYADKKQILLDGTFGICDWRMLLFIVMGIDEHYRGVPLAFLLFSAPTGNRATHAGYNTEIIAKLLIQWANQLTTRGPGHRFAPAVAITDNDAKERQALITTFGPELQLLCCKFHVRQCWANHRNQVLSRSGEGRAMVDSRLRALETTLMDSTAYTEAMRAIEHEQLALKALEIDSPMRSAAQKGLKHLDYLLSSYMGEDFWKCWSEYGRRVAAARMGIPVKGVAPTTNHLESFNAALKGRHLARESHNGHRLRVDVAIWVLVVKVAGSIFLSRQLEDEEQKMIRAALSDIPGSDQLYEVAVPRGKQNLVAYLSSDDLRDAGAKALMQLEYVTWPTVEQDAIVLRCLSSRATTQDSHSFYDVSLRFNSTASCTCPDFQTRGGACKHIRAGLLRVEHIKHWSWTNNPHEPLLQTAQIVLPTSLESALNLQRDTNRHTNAASIQYHTDTDSITRTAGFVTDLLGRIAEENDDVGVTEAYEAESDSESTVDIPIGSTHVGNSEAGLSQQMIGQASYELEKISTKLPSLHEMLGRIRSEDLNTSANRTLFERHLADLEGMTAAMRTLLWSGNTLQSSSTPTQAALAPQERPTSKSDEYAMILPPSPERRQRRKESRSVH